MATPLDIAAYSASLVNWSELGHVYCFGNGKGGVGKTTCTCNIGGLAAADGLRVLIVDLNVQGNVAEELGYAETELDDEGKGLLTAITLQEAVKPIRNVRPNLDVVPGGRLLRRVPGIIGSPINDQERAAAVLTLARILQPVAKEYDLILIDSPPENEHMMQLALGAARWVVVPVKSDKSSRKKGLKALATDYAAMRQYNPYVTLLGAILFATGANATAIRKTVRDDVEATLGGAAPIFDNVIRFAEAVAVAARDRGKLVYELEAAASENPAFWKIRAGLADASQVVSKTSASVSEDFAVVARELFTRAATVQNEMIQEGVWP
ncbi:ParA family protein [Streptomyces sp. NPDC005389]|uniref:ParA family protein n=1 Tax=unclassified Streptomyces TaxID=2593676 RepID=UPI000F9B8C02|nr:ParA family protein [Streptomyces sp. ADI92-24]RPK29194.1 Sporulation initiation inhibitor protein Soj [Streptomyces sp. ADI92-24]